MNNTNIPQNSIEEIKRSIMREYALMLCVPVAVAIFIHGISAIINIAISLAVCWAFATFGKKFLDSQFPFGKYHACVIGITVTLLLPASVPGG